jgi:hypothetical protein
MAMTTAARFRIVPSEPAPTTHDASEHLATLCETVARLSLPPAAPETNRSIAEALYECSTTGHDVLDELEALKRSPAMQGACFVARLGLREAQAQLERVGLNPALEQPLLAARLKLFLGFMTVRQTLVQTEAARMPLWQSVSPLLSARCAVARFGDLLARRRALGTSDPAWSLFVVEAELSVLLQQPALAALGEGPRESLACFKRLLREPPEASPAPADRFALGAFAVADVLAELSARVELRHNDARVLRELAAALVNQRTSPSLVERVRRLTFAVRGLDRELDDVAREAAEGSIPSWSRLLIRTTELLAERFDEVWHSGAPPRF